MLDRVTKHSAYVCWTACPLYNLTGLGCCACSRPGCLHARLAQDAWCVEQGGRWLAGSLVGGLSAIDSWLEAQGVLGSLDKPETEREEQQHGSSKRLTLEVSSLLGPDG